MQGRVLWRQAPCAWLRVAPTCGRTGGACGRGPYRGWQRAARQSSRPLSVYRDEGIGHRRSLTDLTTYHQPLRNGPNQAVRIFGDGRSEQAQCVPPPALSVAVGGREGRPLTTV
eukprot:scaffold97572_cov73-Phaeocystis_antarctica.AAC.3